MELHFRTVEKMIKETLLTTVESNGFYYFHEYQNTYFRKKENDCIYQYAIFGTVAGNRFSLSQQIANRRIEDIIFEIGLPNIDLTNFDRKKNFLFMVNQNNLDEFHFIQLKNIDVIQQFCKNIIHYLQNQGNIFFDKYSYLPNILEEMNNNQKDNIYWSYGILKGTPEPFMAGLIISKLCNDPDYDNKFTYVMGLYSAPENKLTAYLPYLEKLRERLKSVEPIYNVS
ncbi:MAG: hypothetical protein MUF43_12985 [Flavobacterium sp.]|jgi:hypothetical protein|nr:hypothetical protein [Flavobacterium sp.]